MIYSYSLIDAFHNVCPRQARAKYWEKVKQPDTPELIAGQQDHKALEVRLLHRNALPAHLAVCEPICKSIEARAIPLTELRVAVDRDLEPTGFFDNDCYIRGVLDVLLLNDGRRGGFYFDWKTGKNNEHRHGPLQLKMGAAFSFAMHPELQNISAANVYTQNGQLGIAHHWKRTELPEMWREIVPLIHEIEAAEAAGNFPEKPGPLCKWCPDKKCQHNKAP